MKHGSLRNGIIFLKNCDYNLMSVIHIKTLFLVFSIIIMCQICECSDLNNNPTENKIFNFLDKNHGNGDFTTEIFPNKSDDSKVPGWQCHCWHSILETEVFSKIFQISMHEFIFII